MARVSPLYDLQMLGTAVFAVTGVLAVNRRGLDVFGGVVLGTVTSLGGGTVRDLIIGAPVFWLLDTNYVVVAIVAALVAFFAAAPFAVLTRFCSTSTRWARRSSGSRPRRRCSGSSTERSSPSRWAS